LKEAFCDLLKLLSRNLERLWKTTKYLLRITSRTKLNLITAQLTTRFEILEGHGNSFLPDSLLLPVLKHVPVSFASSQLTNHLILTYHAARWYEVERGKCTLGRHLKTLRVVYCPGVRENRKTRVINRAGIR